MWPSPERCLQNQQDSSDFTVVDAHYDDATGMVFACFSPLPGDAGEVMDVEGHHDPGLVRSKHQQLVVAPAIQGPFLVGGANVMAGLA